MATQSFAGTHDAEVVVFAAVGVASSGHLVDHLDQLGSDQRRHCLGHLEVGCLETISQIHHGGLPPQRRQQPPSVRGDGHLALTGELICHLQPEVQTGDDLLDLLPLGDAPLGLIDAHLDVDALVGVVTGPDVIGEVERSHTGTSQPEHDVGDLLGDELGQILRSDPLAEHLREAALSPLHQQPVGFGDEASVEQIGAEVLLPAGGGIAEQALLEEQLAVHPAGLDAETARLLGAGEQSQHLSQRERFECPIERHWGNSSRLPAR